jgi:alkylhydroperoxidase family enzyme
MARLPYLDRSDLQPEFQELLARDINLHRLLVHSPIATRAWHKFAHFIRHESRLDPRLRELAILQIGYLARAAYEWSHHIKIGHDFGVSDDDIRELIKATEGKPTKLDDRTLCVLRAAREMELDRGISKATFEKLRGYLDKVEIVDLIVTIAHYNGIVRLLASLEVDVEPEYLPYLEAFPLPA